jgi:hypothetical protein
MDMICKAKEGETGREQEEEEEEEAKSRQVRRQSFGEQQGEIIITKRN